MFGDIITLCPVTKTLQGIIYVNILAMTENKNLNRPRTPIIIVAVVVFLIILAAIAYPRISAAWTRPLGPQLELPTYTPTILAIEDTEIPSQQPSESANTTERPLPTHTRELTPTIEPTATPEPVCGGPPVMYILGVGSDSGDYLYGLSDVMRIARVDFVNPKVSILTMPRDLWVEIPGISDHYNITHGKLNQAYLYGNPGMGYYDGPGAGPGLLARTLELNFGLRVDHYGAVNMEVFKKIIDRIGGLDLYLATDVDGRPKEDSDAENMGYFNAGQNHFNGDQALRFARIRNKYNDFVRQDNQTMVLCAIKDKLLSPSILPHIPGIVSDFRGEVLTDLSPQQISQLACLLPRISRENLLFASLPQDILVPGRVFSPQQNNYTFILDADKDEIRNYVERFIDGSWPDKPKEPTCP